MLHSEETEPIVSPFNLQSQCSPSDKVMLVVWKGNFKNQLLLGQELNSFYCMELHGFFVLDKTVHSTSGFGCGGKGILSAIRIPQLNGQAILKTLFD